ncbi:Flagellar motor switch protein FliG [Rubellimicrobium mesophilum DSM 19309]|uniref:Flagellar motor switch protein FliG n=1 Tax=Rubellimicrobium mesophilum DSM 19309 TaxID=442562 RepID=A0A017HTM2_9RHOB|nr:FliG C-terminal domain-containing protein [Rubellimicrobium mesophilum]EYD77064.1 Flagellar motor switch protein FliG [Rubellimicrobium mesophilum DSM 19309]
MIRSSDAALDQRRKAAIVVRFLLSDGLRPPLSALPEDAQVALTREMGQLPLVDRATLDAVIGEFSDALEGVGLAPPSGEDAALEAMSGHISPAALARLKAEAAKRHGSDPWAAMAALGTADLAAALARESVEVAAVALSKLPVAKAAEVLGKLPGPQARRITLSVSRTAKVTPDAVRRIGRALAEEHCGTPAPAFPQAPGERLGAILNSSPPATREEVLGGLDAEDKAFAAEVRKAIFTFAHLPRRLKAADVPKVLRAIEPRVAALALAAAQKGKEDEVAAAAFLLASLPQRLAESIREEIATFDRIKPAEAESAQAAILAAVRERVALGELELVEDEDGQAAP